MASNPEGLSRYVNRPPFWMRRVRSRDRRARLAAGPLFLAGVRETLVRIPAPGLPTEAVSRATAPGATGRGEERNDTLEQQGIRRSLCTAPA